MDLPSACHLGTVGQVSENDFDIVLVADPDPALAVNCRSRAARTSLVKPVNTQASACLTGVEGSVEVSISSSVELRLSGLVHTTPQFLHSAAEIV